MKSRFAKISLRHALYSLIPIFPILALIPFALISSGLSKLKIDCIISYKIIFFISLAAISIIVYRFQTNLKDFLNQEEHVIKYKYQYSNYLLYTLLNYTYFVTILGFDNMCGSDGQAILACIMTGPLASVSLLAYGIFNDYKEKTL
jgi:hypothetical protein